MVIVNQLLNANAKLLRCTGTPVAVDAASGSAGNIYPPIPRVNVGPQGEYDRKWVKPGAPLLDFGGHPPSAAAPAINGVGGGNGAGMHGMPNGAGKKGPGAMQKKVPGNKPQKPGATIRPRPAEFRGGADAAGAGAAGAGAGGTQSAPAAAPKFRLVTPVPPAGSPAAAAPATSSGASSSAGVLSGAIASASDIAAAIARTFQPATATTPAAAPAAAVNNIAENPVGASAAAAADTGIPAAAEWGSGGGGGLGLGLGKKGRGGKKKGQGFGPLGGIGGGGAGLGGGAGKKRAARSPMEGMSPLDAESAPADQQQVGAPPEATLPLRKERQRGGGRGGKLRTQAVTGMSLEQASQKDAVIAAVGADKPAWQ